MLSNVKLNNEPMTLNLYVSQEAALQKEIQGYVVKVTKQAR